MKIIVARAIAAFAILVFVYAIVLRVQQNSWLFTPAVYPDGQWDTQRVYSAQDHWVRTSDGLKLNAWLVPAYEPVRTVIYFHARHGNISDQAEHILRLRDARSNVFLIDYRGYGKSEGKPSINGLKLDGEAAYEYVTGTLKVDPAHIVLHGDELGTAVAAHVAAAHPQIAGVVLESPFPRLRTWANSLVPLGGWFMSGGLDEVADLNHYPGPKLFIYGTSGDSAVPGHLSAEVYEQTNDPKLKHEVEDASADEILLATGRDYQNWLNDFFARARLATPEETTPENQLPLVGLGKRARK